MRKFRAGLPDFFQNLRPNLSSILPSFRPNFLYLKKGHIFHKYAILRHMPRQKFFEKNVRNFLKKKNFFCKNSDFQKPILPRIRPDPGSKKNSTAI